MIRQTSIETYNQIKKEGLLSKRRFQVYEILYYHGSLTAGEIWENHLRIKNISQNTCSPRLPELRRAGVIKELGTRICSVTGKNVIFWDVTRNLPIKVEKKLTNSQIIKALVALVKKNHQWHQEVNSVHYINSKLCKQNTKIIKYF